MKIEALIFDVFGTLVDWRTGVASEARALFDARHIQLDSHAFADAWRGEYQPAMQRIRSGDRGYVPLDVLHRENLDRVLDRFGIAELLSQEEQAGLNCAWEKLPPWPDTVSGLTRLKNNYLIAPCSNGSIALMARLSKFGGLPWDAIVGADVAKAYKPQPEAYLRSAEALGLQADRVLMVAAHNSDLDAARACGLATAFFPRPLENGPDGTAETEATSDWDFVATDLENLADLMQQ